MEHHDNVIMKLAIPNQAEHLLYLSIQDLYDSLAT
jgi:hypothetical protein